MRAALAAVLLVTCAGGADGEPCPDVEQAWLRGEYPAPPVPTSYRETGAGFQGVTDQQVRFDPSVPRTATTLWWNGEADLPFSWEFALADHQSIPRSRVVVLLDGVQRSFLVDGVAARTLSLELAAGARGAVQASLAAADVAPGAHSLNLLAVHAASGNAFLGWASTLIKDGDARFATRPDHTPEATLLPDLGDATVLSRGAPLPETQPLALDPDGALPIRALLRPPYNEVCAEPRAPLLFTVLVDFEQRTLEGFGPFVRMVLTPQQVGAFETRVADLPRPDGQKHVLTFLVTHGDGAYGEGPPPFGRWSGLVERPRTLAVGFY